MESMGLRARQVVSGIGCVVVKNYSWGLIMRRLGLEARWLALGGAEWIVGTLMCRLQEFKLGAGLWDWQRPKIPSHRFTQLDSRESGLSITAINNSKLR